MMHLAYNKRLISSRSGFSLFELLVTVFITAVIAGAIVTLMNSQIQLSTTQNRNIINQENLRDAMEFMGDEISNAGSNAEEPFFTTRTATAPQTRLAITRACQPCTGTSTQRRTTG